jgi:RNA 2',3'-cyclic 3'-phosphodiesterase
MRLFVAVDPPAGALVHLDEAVAPVRQDRPDLRWAPPARWHLTLAFLGEVEERHLPELTTRLARSCARHPVAELALAGAGRFDGRVLWAGVAGEVPALSRLAAAVAAAARRSGIAVEERRFRPHVTLARSREPVDLRPAVAALAGYAGSPWQADRVRLVRSVLGPAPRHEELASWPLP